MRPDVNLNFDDVAICEGCNRQIVCVAGFWYHAYNMDTTCGLSSRATPHLNLHRGPNGFRMQGLTDLEAA